MATQDEPLTKADIAQLVTIVGRVDQRMHGVEHKIEDISQKVGTLEHRFDGLEHRFDHFLAKVEEFKDEVTRHFDVVVEDLRHDLIGARSDEVEVLKDGRRDHEKRIRRLEKGAGLIAA